MTKIEEGLKQKFGKWETVMMNMQIKDNDLKSQLTVAKKGNNKARQDVEISKGTVHIEQLKGELNAFRATFENHNCRDQHDSGSNQQHTRRSNNKH
jgi:hypothetical protein